MINYVDLNISLLTDVMVSKYVRDINDHSHLPSDCAVFVTRVIPVTYTEEG